MIWTRTDRPARVWVDIAADPGFSTSRRFRGTAALATTDFNGKAMVRGLEAGRDWFYRVRCESLDVPGLFSRPLEGRFRTAPSAVDNRPEGVRFCWSGDTAGQGFGIDRRRGGMTLYRTMLAHSPDFLVHSGDQIYADVPLPETVRLDDGSLWRNELVEAKTRVAESVQDFRDNFYYNFRDDHLRDFHARVPVYGQWDDHEVLNNWYPGESLLDDNRYEVKNASLLAARSRQALFECTPLCRSSSDPERLYRVVHYGPLLDLFFLDLRSYRGPNSLNRQSSAGPRTRFMGPAQLAWLKSALAGSKATWKIICSDMPLGPMVQEWGTSRAENAANGDGPPLGRELEFADLLGFIHDSHIRNVHFITADVHYCASNFYDPDRARFQRFTPFWEFISGPLHAGTFPPRPLDDTFGPQTRFCGVPDDLSPNRPPSDGYQFFGRVDIDPDDQTLTVSHFNAANERLWSETLQPVV